MTNDDFPTLERTEGGYSLILLVGLAIDQDKISNAEAADQVGTVLENALQGYGAGVELVRVINAPPPLGRSEPASLYVTMMLDMAEYNAARGPGLTGTTAVNQLCEFMHSTVNTARIDGATCYLVRLGGPFTMLPARD